MPSLGDLVVRIVGDNAQLDSSIDKSQKKFENFAKSAANVGKKLTTFVTLPILAIGVAAVKSAADMEMQQAAFETMLGSAKDAAELLNDLKDLAARTPFQLTDLADASKTLLAFGYDADKILPTVRMLGDVAQGNAQRFDTLSLAFGQIQATGRLMGQDLLQLINAGFNPLQEISAKTGVSMAELKKRMEQGAISADMVTEAFESATSEGGRFFGGMERASKTLSGQWSTLMDNIAEMGRGFAEILMPAIKDIVAGLSGLIQRFAGMDDGTKRFILGVLAVVAAIGPLILIVGKLIPMIIALNAAVAANPLLALAAVIGIAVAAFGGYVIAQAASDNAQAALNDTTEEGIELQREQIRLTDEQRLVILRMRQAQLEADIAAKAAVATTFNQKLAVDLLRGALRLVVEEIEGIRQANLDAIGGEAGKLLEERLAQIDQEAILARRLGEEYDIQAEKRRTILSTIQRLIEAGAEAEGEQIQAIITKYGDLLTIEERRARWIKDTADATEDSAKKSEIAAEAERARAQAALDRMDDEKARVEELAAIKAEKIAEVAALEEAAAAHKAELDAQELADAKKLRDARIQLAFDAAVAIGTIGQALFDRQFELRERDLDAALEGLDEESQAYKDIVKEKKRLARDQAIANKVLAAFDTIINTARAVVAMLQIGPAGIPLSIAAGITGAAQLAAILAAPLPALARGGIAMPQAGGVPAILAEAGQPEVIFPLDRLESFLAQRPEGDTRAGGDMVHLQVMIDSKPILDKVFDATRNRTVLIDAGAVV